MTTRQIVEMAEAYAQMMARIGIGWSDIKTAGHHFGMRLAGSRVLTLRQAAEFEQQVMRFAVDYVKFYADSGQKDRVEA